MSKELTEIMINIFGTALANCTKIKASPINSPVIIECSTAVNKENYKEEIIKSVYKFYNDQEKAEENNYSETDSFCLGEIQVHVSSNYLFKHEENLDVLDGLTLDDLDEDLDKTRKKYDKKDIEDRVLISAPVQFYKIIK